MNICEYIWPLHTGVEDKCRNEQSQTHTRTQGGIEAVVTAMGRHADNTELQDKACGALWNLAAYNAENKAKIGAQVENRHEYTRVYVALKRAQESHIGISNRKHTHTHAGGD